MKPDILKGLPTTGTITTGNASDKTKEALEMLEEMEPETIPDALPKCELDEENEFIDPSVPRDKAGDTWDENEHAGTYEQPKYKKDGTFAKRRGRKTESGFNPIKKKIVDPEVRALAVQGTAIFFAAMEALGDEEGTPISNQSYDEFSVNAEALYDVMQARGITSTPEARALMAFGGSVVTRIGKPKTSARIKGFFFKLFKPSLWNFKKRKQTAPAPENKRNIFGQTKKGK